MIKMDVFDYFLMRPSKIEFSGDYIEKIMYLWTMRCGVGFDDVNLYFVLTRMSYLLNSFIEEGYLKHTLYEKIYSKMNELMGAFPPFGEGKNRLGGDIIKDQNEALILAHISIFDCFVTKQMLEENVGYLQDEIDDLRVTMKEESFWEYISNIMLDSIGVEKMDMTYPLINNELFKWFVMDKVKNKTGKDEFCFDIVKEHFEDIIESYSLFVQGKITDKLNKCTDYHFSMITYNKDLSIDNIDKYIEDLIPLSDENKTINKRNNGFNWV